MKKLICSLIGHKWSENNDIRECDRCGEIQRKTLVTIYKIGDGMFRKIKTA